MVSNWSWEHDKIDGKHWRDYLTLDVNGLNVDGQPVYIYYCCSSNACYNKEEQTIAKFAGEFIPPCQVKISWDINSNRDDYEIFYVLFADKPQNVDTVRKDIPLKHWYGFRDYSGFDGLNPSKGDNIYNHRR